MLRKLASIAMFVSTPGCVAETIVDPPPPPECPSSDLYPETTYCAAVADLQVDLEACNSGANVGELCAEPDECAPADDAQFCEALGKLRARRYTACGVGTLACDLDSDCSPGVSCLCGGCQATACQSPACTVGPIACEDDTDCGIGVCDLDKGICQSPE